MTAPERTRQLALYVLCVGVLMIVLDVTVVNVALPSIQDSLHFGTASLAWVVNAYLIAFGGLLMLAGRLGDLVGRRRVFLVGLTVFTAASLLCGASTSQAMLITARFLQGAGGALTSAVILGMIVTMFPEPREQAKAIGVYAFVASAGGAVGLLAGGVLTQSLNWHWIFFVNVPIGIATGIAALRLIEDDEGIGIAAGADLPGAALGTLGLMLAVYTIVKPAAQDGWTSGPTLGWGAAAVALLALFAWRETMARTPLLPLRIFGSRNVAGANLIQAVGAAGMFGCFFLGSLYLQRVLHYDPLQIGLAFLPVTLLMGTLSVRYTERLMMSFGARRTMLPGLVLIALGVLWLTRAPAHGSYVVDVLPMAILLGAGAGLSFPAIMTIAMADATPADAGLTSGLINTTAQVGGALGLAVLATLSGSRTAHLRATGHSLESALTGGYHIAFAVAAALLAVAIVVAVVVLPVPKSGNETETAQELADDELLAR